MEYKNALYALKKLIEDNPKDGLLHTFGNEHYSSYLATLQMQVFNRFGLKLVVINKEDYVPEKVWTVENIEWLLKNHFVEERDVIYAYEDYLKNDANLTRENYWTMRDKAHEFEKLSRSDQFKAAFDNIDTSTLRKVIEELKKKNGFEENE